MYCKRCGSELPQDAAFCPKCGTKVSTGEEISNEPPKQETIEKIQKQPLAQKTNEQAQKTSKPQVPLYKKWWFWLIVAWLSLGLISAIFGEDSPDETQKEDAVLSFLNDFTEYGYSEEQIKGMKTILVNVGITEITDLEIGNVVSGMQVIKGKIYDDPDYKYTGKEVHATFCIENGKIYLVSIYCPSYNTADQPTYLSGLTDRRADLYYDVKGGYLKKIDWKNKEVIDYYAESQSGEGGDRGHNVNDVNIPR